MSEDMHIDRDEFQNHVKQEERDRLQLNERLAEGNLRMGQIEKDLRPLQALYHAVLGSTVIGAALIGLVLFIYQNDREAIKLMGEAVQKQGEAAQKQSLILERVVLKLDEVEKDTHKEFDRVEKRLDKVGKL